MKTASTCFLAAAAALLGSLGLSDRAQAQGTAFQYQGRLQQSGNPATGLYDLRFTLFDSSGGGTTVGGPLTQPGVGVTNGLFNVALDFGAGVFAGAPRWMEIAVRTNNSATFTSLSPRQALLPTPHAIYAGTSSNVVNGTVVKSLNNLRDNVTLAAGANVTLTPSGNTLTIASTGSSSGGPWTVNGANIYYNGGNVGIGTATPVAALEVNSLNGNGLIYATAPRPNLIFRDTIAGNARGIIGGFDGGLRFYSENFWSGASSTAFLAMDRNGSFGIGTLSPQSALHITDRPDAIRLTGASPYLTFEDRSFGLFSRIQAFGAGMTLKTQGAISGSNPSGLLSLTGVGYVGIGTTNPNSKLTIMGTPSWTANFWGSAIELENASAIGWQANAGGQRFGMGHSTGGFYLFRTTDDPGTVSSLVSYDVTVTDVGYVGLGTSTPARRLTVASPFYGIEHTDGVVRLSTYLSSTGGWLGTVSNHPLNFYVNDGGPSMTITTSGNVGFGTSNPQAKLEVAGTTRTRVLTILGGSDLAEPFPMKSEDLPKGSVVVIDEDHPGRLMQSEQAYDTRVAGIVSGANGINPGITLQQEGAFPVGPNVALSGRVYVLADAKAGAIKPGDLLTTSDTPGHAMKATDRVRAQGAILGKAMSGLAEGQGMVLVLVTLQ